jgi:hypothetical protein
MNERLTELYRACRPKEALASQDEFKSANGLLGSEVEKFAELIVKECAQVASNQVMDVEGNDWGVRHAVEKHFGVEE